MEGKKALLDQFKGEVEVIEVEALEIGAPLEGSRCRPVVPDDGRIASAYPHLRPTRKVVRWRHPAEPETSAQSGHVWLEPDGTPVLVHGDCFGVFALADVVILSDGSEPESGGFSNLARD
jgi:hypothetical protein